MFTIYNVRARINAWSNKHVKWELLKNDDNRAVIPYDKIPGNKSDKTMLNHVRVCLNILLKYFATCESA